MSETNQQISDIWAIGPQLKLALTDSALLDLQSDKAQDYSPEARAAAFHVAVLLGEARLFAADLADADGELTPAMATAAATAVGESIRRQIAAIPALEDRWDSLDAASDGLDLICDVIQGAFDAWAAITAVEEPYLTGLVPLLGGHAAPAWFADLQRLRDAYLRNFEQLNTALRAQATLLTVVCDTHLLDNLRAGLLPEYQALAPWWLSGELEELSAWLQSDDGPLAESPEYVEKMRQRAIRNRFRWMLGDVARPLAAAAAGGGADAGQTLLLTRWRHASGRTADLVIDETLPENARVALAFFEPDQTPAASLQGQSAKLAGIGAQIDDQAIAWFTKAQLRSGSNPPELLVGSEETPWPRQSSNA